MVGRGLSVLFIGMLLIFGIILIVPENCTPVVIVQVGGCNVYGRCGVLFSDENNFSKLNRGRAYFPVVGATECKENLF